MERGTHGYAAEAGRMHESREGGQREALERRWQETGDVEVEGVSKEAKRDFVAEKLKETDRKIAELWRQAKTLERLRELYDENAKPGVDFSEDDKTWFAEGENPERMTLEASWESDESLDVDDIPDAAKAAFASAKLESLRGARRLGVGNPDALDAKIRKLEVYVEQYGKNAGA